MTLTAYVVEFLSEAKKAGYQFPPKLMEKPVAALKEALRSDYAHFIDGASFMERCEALAALSNAGQFDVSYGSELGKKAGFLDLYSEAKVLQACNLGQKCSKDIFEKLRKDLWDNTLFKLRDGSEVYGGLQSRIKSWGGQALSSEIKTQAAMIRALYPKDAANPKFQLMVRDLIESGEKDGWGNTNTNAAALLALRDIISTPRKDMPAAELSVDFGDSKNPLHIGADQPTAFLLSRDVRQGKVNMTSGGGKLYARMNVTYLPQAMGDQVAAKNEGFVVTREIIRVSTGSEPNTKEWIEKPGTTITCRLGDITEEHIQVINPDDRNYVAVIAPFAAGLEPMNPNLATSPKEAQPSGSLTRDPSYAMYIDDEVRFYYEQLPKGTYDFYFRIRAMTEGSYVHPAAHAEMMYQPATKGNSAGARVVIEKGEETDK